MGPDFEPRGRLGDYLSVVRRRWVVLLLSLLLSLTWGWRSYQPGIAEYEAQVLVRIVPPQSRDTMFGDVSNVTGQDRSLEAHAKFLTSPEFTRLVAQQAIVEQLAKARRYGPSMLWPGLDAGLARAAETVTPQILQDPATQSLTLKFRSASREQVTVAAELVPRMFTKLNESRINRKYIDLKRFIRKKLHLFQDRERDLTRRIWELRGSANAYTMGEQALVQTEKMLADTSLQKELLQASLEEYRAQIEKARERGVQGPDPSDQIVERLIAKLVDLEYDRTLLLRDYTEAHPDVRDVSREISVTREALDDKLREMIERGDGAVSPLDWYETQVAEAMNLELELGALERKEGALRVTLNDTIRSAQTIAGFQQRLARLEADAKYFRDLSHQFHSKLVNLELSIEMDREGQGYVEIVNRLAPGPEETRRSNPTRHFGVWTLFGLFVGLLFVFFVDYCDTTIKTEDDARRWLGVPALASIPVLKELRRPDFPKRVYDFERGGSFMAAFRILRNQVEFKSIDRSLRTVLVTSARAGEGKTSVVSGLAISLAQKGEQVLLVDCDLRRPAVHQVMELAQSPGISNAVMGETPWRDAVQATEIPNLSVLAAGDLPAHSSELLGSSQMQALIGEFSASYDRVLFDSASALAVTDAAWLASIVDGVLVVAQANKTPRGDTRRTLEILSAAGARVVGLTLNRARGAACVEDYPSYYSERELEEAG